MRMLADGPSLHLPGFLNTGDGELASSGCWLVSYHAAFTVNSSARSYLMTPEAHSAQASTSRPSGSCPTR